MDASGVRVGAAAYHPLPTRPQGVLVLNPRDPWGRIGLHGNPMVSPWPRAQPFWKLPTSLGSGPLGPGLKTHTQRKLEGALGPLRVTTH